VQLREAIGQRALQSNIDLVEFDVDYSATFTDEARRQVIDRLLALNLDAIVCAYLPAVLARPLLEHGIPIIHLTETDSELRHPRFCSLRSYYEIACLVGSFIAERLHGRGSVLALGGLMATHGEDGRSRLQGIRDRLSAFPGITLEHFPSVWRYERAFPQIQAALRRVQAPPDAIFGFSDSIALAALDAACSQGLLAPHTLVIGINGDPLALAAIAEGRMHATVETPVADFAVLALDLARRAAHGEALPEYFNYQPRLVTTANVAQVAAQTLLSMADLPSRLVGVNRQRERARLTQLETSLAINRRIGAILDRGRLISEISELIRDSYGFDAVHLLRWSDSEQALVHEHPAAGAPAPCPPADDPALRNALAHMQVVAIPDTQRLTPPDPHAPRGERVVVPVRLGTAAWGLLDLRARSPAYRSAEELTGLQILADQLGIAIHNAELYGEALEARAQAEQTNRQKTRLLANVSHELRGPLTTLRSYSLLMRQSLDDRDLAAQHDLLRHMTISVEHLDALSNDLLDLSRAEIGELRVALEPIDLRSLLAEIFESFTATLPGAVAGRQELPASLPSVQADRVRLRQVLLNLLENAAKFTECGEIALGAEALERELQIWVRDTGVGIPAEIQGEIFEPFVRGVPARGTRPGVGLGLSIARWLVTLHAGRLSVESVAGQGSTFRIWLPLARLAAQSTGAQQDALLLISSREQPDSAVLELAAERNLQVWRMRTLADLEALPAGVAPSALAWDIEHARPEDWAIVRALRAMPVLARLPLIVFRGGEVTLPASGTAIASLPVDGGVLIVDDDSATRDLYRRLIERALPGYSIRTAGDGRSAIELLNHERPALVILDLVMPGVDGFGVLEWMRADPRLSSVPVVVVSGHTPTFEQIARLNHPLVTFQSKDVLSEDETATFLRRSLFAGQALSAPTSVLVKRAIAYLQQHHARDLSRQELAEAVGISQSYLSDIFHRELGMAPWEYLNRYRIKLARDLLRRTDDSITSIAGRVGFDDAAYFSRVFRRVIGRSPRDYRERR
jgi:signal transduction histidine kinase/AraC-like DNA-binding protein